MSVTPFLAHQQPIGTFHAVASRDASSLDRDGHPYYASNRLETRDGRPLVEVQFVDGTWLLADPEHDLVPGFEIDVVPDRVFLALAYGEPWNGWVTPILCRSALAELLTALDVPHRWEGDALTVRDQEDDDFMVLLRPDARGGYDSAPLGLMLERLQV